MLINGLMDKLMWVIGGEIRCMGRVYFNGLMAINIQETTRKIKRMVMEFFNLLMVKYTKEHGIMENNMAKGL